MTLTPSLAVPCRYGKFDLLECIGVGGMAEVYKARMSGIAGFERVVVVKRILPHLARDPRISSMFITEAKLAARVQHRNVVQVFELNAAGDGELYMAMEYVAGTDLANLLRQSVKKKLRVPIWFSLHALSETLNGLAVAHDLADDAGHALGVVHRDVTPSNVFISFLGDIKLGDFGVASSKLQTQETRAGELKGKVAYMSPEQLRAQPVDARTDIFAAGVVLWEMLAQRRLFGGRPELETMNLICTGPRVPPSRSMRDVPPELDAIVLRAIDPDPAVRFASAAELQHAIAELLPHFAARILPSDVRRIVDGVLGRTQTPTAGSDPGSASPAPLEPLSEFEVKSKSGASGGPGPLTRGLGNPSITPGGTPRRETTRSLLGGTSSSLSPSRAFSVAMVPPREGPAILGEIQLEFEDDEAPPPPAVVEAPLQPKEDSARVLSVADRRAEMLAHTPPWQGVVTQLQRTHADGTPYAYDGGYRGPTPFWLKNEEDVLWGPVDHRALRSYLATDTERAVHRFMLASTGTQWVDLDAFAILSGQEALLDVPPLDAAHALGNLKQRSLASVLSKLWAVRATGSLVMTGEGVARPPFRAFHVRDGVPIYVQTDASKLQLPEIAVRQKLVKADLIPELMQELLSTLQPFEALVARRAQVALEQCYPLLMRERALEPFTWKAGHYAFRADLVPQRGIPFQRSLLQLAYQGLMKTRTDLDVAPYFEAAPDLRLAPTDRWAPGVRALGLNDADGKLLAELAQGAPLAHMLKRKTPDEQATIRMMAYAAIELGLLSGVTSAPNAQPPPRGTSGFFPPSWGPRRE
jgi:serine/threonine protein kinase